MSTPAGSAVTPSGSSAPAGGGDGLAVELEGGIGGIEVIDVLGKPVALTALLEAAGTDTAVVLLRHWLCGQCHG